MPEMAEFVRFAQVLGAPHQEALEKAVFGKELGLIGRQSILAAAESALRSSLPRLKQIGYHVDLATVYLGKGGVEGNVGFWNHIQEGLTLGIQGTEDELFDTFVLTWPLAANGARRQRSQSRDPSTAMTVACLANCVEVIGTVADRSATRGKGALAMMVYDAFHLLYNVEVLARPFLDLDETRRRTILSGANASAATLDKATLGRFGFVQWLRGALS